MILRFFNSGKSNGSSPINYLLAKSDSKKQVRGPAPEVAMGDPELTKDLIDCNPRKYKYTSGVLAFRDGELPTKAQQKEIMKDFFLTFCAGLKPNQANMLWVRHQDKGNLELHFIVPRLEMTTMRAMNIMPPGKKSQQMARDFSSSWNHKLGFGQVVDDPLKAAFIDLDKKIPDRTRHGKFVEKIGANISRLIRQGKISNRDDLISLLEAKDFTITRKGTDYLSIGLPASFGVKKAIRFKGPVYSANANYAELGKQSELMAGRTMLADVEFLRVSQRLSQAIEDRKQFNAKCFTVKKRTCYLPGERPQPAAKVSKPTLPAGVTTAKSTSSKAAEVKPTTVREVPKTVGVQPPVSMVNKIAAMRQKTQEPVSDSPSSLHNGGGLQALLVSLGQLESQITGATIKASSAKSAAEAALLMQKVYALISERERLHGRLKEARLRQINSTDRKPPGFG